MTGTLLSLSDIPRDADGVLVGHYFARSPSDTRIEGWEERLDSHEVLHLDAIFGADVRFLPADEASAEGCARHVYEMTGDGVRAKALRAMFAKPRPKKVEGAKKRTA